MERLTLIGRNPKGRKLPHFLVAFAVCGAAIVLLQGSPYRLRAQNRPPAPAVEERGSIRVEVNLVSLLASVLDRNNRPVPDLQQDQFEIFDEGKRQKIELFETETQQPLDLALMVDSSLSETTKLRFETEAAERFVKQVMRPVDRVAVYEIGDSVTRLIDFSNQPDRVRAALQKIVPGTGTALYDAVYLGSRALDRDQNQRRRALVLLTDAGETTSRADFELARTAAVTAQALLYAIVVRPVGNEGGRNTAGEHALETIADTTGGALYFPSQISQLNEMFDRIDSELRTQYRLGYYPDPLPPRGSYRQIEVRVKGDYTVRYRKAYYAGDPPN